MELLDLRYDAAFKEFFKDKELLSSFISTITGKELEVESLQYTEEKAISKVYQISEIDEVQLKVIEEALEESKRLDWQDDIIEKVQEEKINFSRSLLDVLDDETIPDKTGLDINFIKSLRR